MTIFSDTLADPPSALTEITVRPGHPRYESRRDTYIRRGSPAEIFLVRNEADIAEVLQRVRSNRRPLSLRSCGHGVSGRSTNDGGSVIDVSRLDRIEVLDASARLVRVGPGARWGDVARALTPHGLAISSGDDGNVGVGGLATAGGIGLLTRSRGLTIDSVRAVELVLADGSFVRADAQCNTDLFWAMRGAGANFGVATAFEIEAAPVGDVVAAVVIFDAGDTATFITRWADAVEQAPRELTSFMTLIPGEAGFGPMAQVITVFAGDDEQAGREAIAPIMAAGPVLDGKVQLMPYQNLLPATVSVHHAEQPLSEVRSGLLPHITAEVAGAAESALKSGRVPMVQYRSVGGAVNDVAPDATAYAHRSQNFAVMSAAFPADVAALDAYWQQLGPYLDGVYVSFESRFDDRLLRAAFPGGTLQRLRALKAEYDPEQVFRDNFPIPPAL